MLRALGLAVVALLALTFTPVPNLIADGLEMSPRLAPADAIVVLGNGINADGALSENSLRGAEHGVDLFRKGLAPLLVFSGNRAGPFDEAEVRARRAEAMGVDRHAIVLETEAHTTREEAARIRVLLAARGVRTVLLVTSPFHLRRATALFERAGLRVYPAPAYRASTTWTSPTERLHLLWSALQEAVARAYYRLNGYL